MPKCDKCNSFLPPDMIDEPDEQNKRLCHFCKNNTYIVFNESGQSYVKQDVINDYKQYIDELYRNENIQKTLTDQMVKQAIKNSKP